MKELNQNQRDCVISIIYIALTAILFYISSRINGLSRQVLDYDNIEYFTFNSSYKIKLIVFILSTVLLIATGIILGIKKNCLTLFSIVIFLSLFKISIIIFDFINESLSNLLWGVYLSPICLLSDSLDILVWVFYEILLLIPFVACVLLKQFTAKKRNA